MPLRSGPLPRMAGHLSFMRSQSKEICDVKSGDLVVAGLPFEDTNAPYAGQSLASRALRETSVYFGWHANPQFSHPVDIDAREIIQTDGLHERLCDLGDIPIGDDKKSHTSLRELTRQINRIGACAIMLGGSDQMSDTVQSSLPKCQKVQLGGILRNESDFHVAPMQNDFNPICKLNMSEQLNNFFQWRDNSKPLFVQFDLSVFETSLSVLCDQPRLGGCNLDTVTKWLSAIGKQKVSAIMLTGLNPDRPGMGVIKVGQRLMVTSLLAFIYSRLGFESDLKNTNSKENVAL